MKEQLEARAKALQAELDGLKRVIEKQENCLILGVMTSSHLVNLILKSVMRLNCVMKFRLQIKVNLCLM